MKRIVRQLSKDEAIVLFLAGATDGRDVMTTSRLELWVPGEEVSQCLLASWDTGDCLEGLTKGLYVCFLLEDS